MLRLAEILIALFLAWILANVIRAVAWKTSKGGGFWAVSDMITKEDREKVKLAEIEAEVSKRVAAVKARLEEGGREQK